MRGASVCWSAQLGAAAEAKITNQRRKPRTRHFRSHQKTQTHNPNKKSKHACALPLTTHTRTHTCDLAWAVTSPVALRERASTHTVRTLVHALSKALTITVDGPRIAPPNMLLQQTHSGPHTTHVGAPPQLSTLRSCSLLQLFAEFDNLYDEPPVSSPTVVSSRRVSVRVLGWGEKRDEEWEWPSSGSFGELRVCASAQTSSARKNNTSQPIFICWLRFGLGRLERAP